MNNDEQEKKKQWKMMKKRENTQWKMMKKRGKTMKNNEQ